MPDKEKTAKSKYSKLLINTFLIGFGTFGSKLLVFLLVPLYTALLTTAEYGTADLLAQTANLLMPMASIGVANAAFRMVADGKEGEERKKIFSSCFAWLSIGFLVFLVLSTVFFFIPYYRGYEWLVILYVLCADIHQVCAYYLRGIDKTRFFALQGIFNTAVTIGLNLLFLMVFGMGVTGYVLSVILADFLSTVLIFVCTGIGKDLSFRAVEKESMRQIVQYSAPLIFSTILWWVTDVSDRFMVTYFHGDSVNGIYTVSYKIPTLLTLVTGVFYEAWQYSAVSESKDPQELNRFYKVVYEGFSGALFMLCSLIILACRWIASFWFDPDYYEAWQYIPTLLLATVFSSLVTFLGSVYLVKKTTVKSMLTAGLAAGINLVLNLIWIPKWGPIGAALATLICYFVVYFIRRYSAWRDVGLSLCWIRFPISLLALGAAAFCMTRQVPHDYLWAAGLTVLVWGVNIPSEWKAFRVFRTAFTRRKNNKKEVIDEEI